MGHAQPTIRPLASGVHALDHAHRYPDDGDALRVAWTVGDPAIAVRRPGALWDVVRAPEVGAYGVVLDVTTGVVGVHRDPAGRSLVTLDAPYRDVTLDADECRALALVLLAVADRLDDEDDA